MARTRKKAYTGSKKFDKTCRNHGSCPYCERNRRIKELRDKETAETFKHEIYDGRNPNSKVD